MPALSIATIDTMALRIPLDVWAPPPSFAGRPHPSRLTRCARWRLRMANVL